MLLFPGYHHPNILRADMPPEGQPNAFVWSKDAGSFRAIVEMIIRLVKRYRLASEYCRLSVQKQLLALKVVYQLVGRIYSAYRLRPIPAADFVLPDNVEENVELVVAPNNQ
jgi:hypothetical protein